MGRYPHPGRGFTQGLIAGSGSAREIALWESVGGYGESAMCRYRLGHLEPQRRVPLPSGLFGEGICRVGAHIWQLTWRERVALCWDARTLELLQEVPFNRDGWGICVADGVVVTSDGSGELVLRDPDTLSPRDVIHVRCEGIRILGLNDLTWSARTIWANLAGTHLLAGIDPDSGEVTDVVDARAAWERHLRDAQAIMNGIAAIPANGQFLLTGKTYRYIRHVRLVPVSARSGVRTVRRLIAGRGGLSV